MLNASHFPYKLPSAFMLLMITIIRLFEGKKGWETKL